MAGINPEMTPQEFMDSFVPELISSKLGGVTFPPIKDAIQIDIRGAGQWLAQIEQGRPVLKAGKAGDPWVTVVVSSEAIQMGIGRAAGEVGDLDTLEVTGPVQEMAKGLTQEVVDAIRTQVQGTIKFAITTNTGGEEYAVIGFNALDLESPTCTVKTTERELVEMAESGLKPQEAFMAGKIRLDGDMAPVMMLVMNAMPIIEPGMGFLSKYLRGR